MRYMYMYRYMYIVYMQINTGLSYSRKLSREKTFANWWRIRNSRRKLSWIASTTNYVWVWPPFFAEKTFADGPKTLEIREGFLPRKFPAIRYTPSPYLIVMGLNGGSSSPPSSSSLLLNVRSITTGPESSLWSRPRPLPTPSLSTSSGVSLIITGE